MHPRHLLYGIPWGLTLAIAVAIAVQLGLPVRLEARVVDHPQKGGQWRTLTELDVASGSTIPARINTVVHIPTSVKSIAREVFFGHRGGGVRYWGYCFEDEDDPENPPQTVGFPGKLFLSERERQWRKEQEEAQRGATPLHLPARKPTFRATTSAIRHQLETLLGGMTCYVMSDQELPVGTDADGDLLNAKLESKFRTKPNDADTDGDGINDGAEVLSLGSNPTLRDSDSDGIIDGLEDANHNGRWDPGETFATKADSDNDTLCDGYCRVFKVRKICKDNKGFDCLEVPYGAWIGEDKNLNGKLDTGETDPRTPDTDGDGILDDQEYYKCLLDRKGNC